MWRRRRKARRRRVAGAGSFVPGQGVNALVHTPSHIVYAAAHALIYSDDSEYVCGRIR